MSNLVTLLLWHKYLLEKLFHGRGEYIWSLALEGWLAGPRYLIMKYREESPLVKKEARKGLRFCAGMPHGGAAGSSHVWMRERPAPSPQGLCRSHSHHGDCSIFWNVLFDALLGTVGGLGGVRGRSCISGAVVASCPAFARGLMMLFCPPSASSFLQGAWYRPCGPLGGNS